MKFLAVSSFALLFLNQVLAKPAEGCLQNYTITEVDSCVSVAAQFKLTEADFYAMNPGLHHSVQHNCDNLDTGKPFCVCMKQPCAVSTVPVGSSAVPSGANSTIPVTAVPSGASSVVSSASAAASSVSSSTARANTTVSAHSISASASSSSSNPTTSPTAQKGNSASSLTTAFGAISIGLVMTATTVLL